MSSGSDWPSGENRPDLVELRQATIDAPWSASAWLELGECLLQEDEPQLAAEALNEAVRLDPVNGDVLYLYGRALFLADELDDAIQALEHALAVCPDHGFALLQLGWAYREDGRYSEAIDSFRAGLRFESGCIKAHVALGTALACLWRDTEAIAAYMEALRVDPRCVTAHYNIGVLSSYLGDLKLAREQHRILLDLDIDSAELLWLSIRERCA